MNDHDRGTVDDVRMRGFARRHTVAAALDWLDAQVRPPECEVVPLRMAAGRVLANAVVSDVDVPGFDRATMDGYAVMADSTEGATSYNRLPLVVIGDSLPGHPFHGSVGVGQGVRIMTGAPLPLGCDAVLPAEWIEIDAETDATATVSPRPVSPGKHVGRRGRHCPGPCSGLTCCARKIRACWAWLGELTGVQPATGAPGGDRQRTAAVRSQPRGYQIADANDRPRRAVERDGGVVDFPGLMPDDHDAILMRFRPRPM